MTPDEIKQRVRQEILETQFPELVDIEPNVRSGPAESQLRTLRRSRRMITDDDVKSIPVEHQFIYHLPERDEQPFDKTLVVVTDEEGKTQYIIESK